MSDNGKQTVLEMLEDNDATEQKRRDDGKLKMFYILYILEMFYMWVCKIPRGVIIFLLGIIVGGLVVVIIWYTLPYTRDVTPDCNISSTTDVPLETTGPINTSTVMNGTEDVPVLPSTLPPPYGYREALLQQRKKLENATKCHEPEIHVINVKSELEGWDSLSDKDLWRPMVAVYRCPPYALCLRGKQCLPSKVKHTTYIVEYLEGNQRKYAKRNLTEHVECSCEFE